MACAYEQLRGLQPRRLQHIPCEAPRDEQVIQRDENRRLLADLQCERTGVNRVVDACGRHVQSRVVAAQLDAYLRNIGRDVYFRSARS